MNASRNESAGACRPAARARLGKRTHEGWIVARDDALRYAAGMAVARSALNVSKRQAKTGRGERQMRAGGDEQPVAGCSSRRRVRPRLRRAPSPRLDTKRPEPVGCSIRERDRPRTSPCARQAGFVLLRVGFVRAATGAEPGRTNLRPSGLPRATSVASSKRPIQHRHFASAHAACNLIGVVRYNDRGPQDRFRFGETSVFDPREPKADRRAGGCHVARLARSFERRRRAIDVPTLQCEKPQAKRGLCERLHRSPATEQADGSR